MAREVSETLIGYQFSVRQGEVPVTDEKGNPLFKGGAGGPKMQPQWIIDFIETTPHVRHIVHVPLSREAKDTLVRALTGGIAVASEIPQGPIAI